MRACPGVTTTASCRRRDVEARRLHARATPATRHSASAMASTTAAAAVHRSARRIVSRAMTRSGSTSRQPRLGGAHQEAVERARRLRRQPLGRGDDDVVELAVLLLGETRQLAIAGRPAQRRPQTDHGGHRGHDGRDEEAHEREAGRRRRGVDGPRGAGDERRPPPPAAPRHAAGSAPASAAAGRRASLATSGQRSCHGLLTRSRHQPPAAGDRLPTPAAPATPIRHEPPQALTGLALAGDGRGSAPFRLDAPDGGDDRLRLQRAGRPTPADRR